MGIDHRRRNIGMTEQLLNRANVVPRFERMGGEPDETTSDISPSQGSKAWKNFAEFA
jgi:hypothetical protein